MADPNDSFTPRRHAWSNYWAQGNLHSLPGSFEGNYAGAIADFWQAQFRELTATRRMLDIGTGNGALPQLVWRQHALAMPSVDAVDLAQVAPVWLSEVPAACREAVHFQGGVAAEELPFTDACFHLVVSQYAIEYTETSRSLRELARVLATGGKVALLMHHHDSCLASVAREELRLSEWLLAADGFLARLEAAIPWFVATGSSTGMPSTERDFRASQARQSCDAACTVLEQMASTSTVPDLLHEAREFASQAQSELNQQPAQAILVHCYNYRKALENAKLRYSELCQNALDEHGVQAFAQKLEEHGLVQSHYTSICNEDGLLMGWTLTARKPG